MMEEEGSEGVVEAVISEGELEDVGLDDRQARVIGLGGGGARGDWVAIDGNDVNVEIVLGGPGEDGAGDVGGAGGQINNVDALVGFPGAAEALEVVDDGAGVAEKAVDELDVTKGAVELAGIDIVVVHELVAADAGVVEPVEHANIFADNNFGVI
jgi:hypothetical protein